MSAKDAVEISPAGPGDLDTVLGLVERLLLELEERPGEFGGVDRGRSRAEIAAAGQRFAAFLARESGRAVGVLTLGEQVSIYAGGRFGVIQELYVEPGRRSSSVGARLVEAARAHAIARGWRRLEVTAPPGAAWERSVRFYERQGFVFTGPKLRLDLPRI